MTLGQNLQAARKAKGLSQETLAEQIGVSRQALGKWEKDTALPGLDNLQAAAQVLGVSVDTLLGTEAAGPAPAVTLDAMRDLLAARDAEQRKHRRLWGLLGAAAAVVVVLLLVVQNLAYQRKMQSLTDSYAMLQSQLSSTTADLSTRMDELQDAVRQGKSTVLEWRWVPVDKLHRDVQSSWMPVLVQVTPSESTTGMTARLSVTYGDTTELHDMDVLAGDIYQAQLVFTVGQTYDLTIQWTAADGAANEKLGTVDFTATQTEPELAWGRTGGTLDYGYYINRSGSKKYLQLSCYPVEVELTAPNWMKIADVTLELRTGEEGEPLAAAQLAADGWYSSGEETMMHAVWNGTFYKDDGPNEWLYTDGQPFYRAIVTDATGTTWTFEMPLQEK